VGAAGVLAILVLASCGTSSDVEVGAPGSTTTPPSSGGSGSTTIADVALKTLTANGKGSAFHIGVPESWTSVDTAAQSPDEVAKQIAELFPNGADAATLAKAIRQGLVLFAIDPTTGANVNVLVEDEVVQLDALAKQIDDQLKTVGAEPAVLTYPTIAGRESLRADTRLAKPAARVTQFYVATDTQTFITTITRPTITSGEAPVDAMAASVTIG
jgi:hypothetical protein